MELDVHPVAGRECQHAGDAGGSLPAHLVHLGGRTQRVAGEVVAVFPAALVVGHGDGSAGGVGERCAGVDFGAEMIPVAVLERGFRIGLVARRLEHIIDRARQGRAPVERALRTLDDLHPLQRGQRNRRMALFDDDAVNEQSGVGPPEDVGLPPDDRPEVVAPERLREIEPRRGIGNVLQRGDALFLQRLFGERADRQGYVAQVLLDFSGRYHNLFQARPFLGEHERDRTDAERQRSQGRCAGPAADSGGSRRAGGVVHHCSPTSGRGREARARRAVHFAVSA